MPRRRLALLALMFAGQLHSALAESARYFQSSDGTTLAYFEKGSGPPVVLLAGGYALSHRYLQPVAERLAATHRVILPDQRGTGLSKLSQYNQATLNLDKLIEDLDALRMHLGLRKLNLLGHSWGGMLAMSYAAAHPNRIDSMVLVDSGGADLAFRPLYAAATAARLKLVLTSEEQERLDSLMTRAAAPPMPPQVQSEISHLRSAALFHDRRHAAALEQLFDIDPINEPAAEVIVADLQQRNWNVRPALRHLHAKVLVIHGLDDPMPIRVAKETQQAIRGARLRVIADCGHYPWLEQPAFFFSALDELGPRWKTGAAPAAERDK